MEKDVQTSSLRKGIRRKDQSSGVTLRALLIGITLIPLNAYWVVHMGSLYRQPEVSTVSLMFNTVFYLLILILFNFFVARFLPRSAFRRGEGTKSVSESDSHFHWSNPRRLHLDGDLDPHPPVFSRGNLCQFLVSSESMVKIGLKNRPLMKEIKQPILVCDALHDAFHK